jgi:hypothetical protein
MREARIFWGVLAVVFFLYTALSFTADAFADGSIDRHRVIITIILTFSLVTSYPRNDKDNER